MSLWVGFHLREGIGRRPGLEALVAGAFWAVLLGQPGVVAAQSTRDRPPDWTGELAFIGGNALLGGATAALLQHLRGGSAWDAFRAGALGGGVAYAGRRIAVEPFRGAGLIGRQVSGVGTSMVRNAADGWSPFARLVLPYGPARIYLATDSTSPLRFGARVKLDLPTLVATAVVALRHRSTLDIETSLSVGTPVLVGKEFWTDEGWAGYQMAGMIWLRGNPDDPTPFVERRVVLSHELVHVLQYDFTFLTWSDPAEEWIIARMPGGKWINQWFDLGLHLAAWGAANSLIPHEQRP
ncbi:MAG: hypothetical protein ACREF4_21775, partial [Gammaproteobacteria bacterium]